MTFLRMTTLAKEFSLATDARVHIATRIEEFALLRTCPDLMAVTMRNPVDIPKDPVSREMIMNATRSNQRGPRGTPSQHTFYVSPGDYLNPPSDRDPELPLSMVHHNPATTSLELMPDCIRETILVAHRAFALAKWDERYPIMLRQSSVYPTFPHQHEKGVVSGVVGIFGNGMKVFEGNHENFAGRDYDLWRGYMTAFRDLVHRAGDPDPNEDRLNVVFF